MAVAAPKKIGNQDIYWPLDTAENVIASLDARRTDFWSFLQRTGIDERVFRVWKYYHGYFYGNVGGWRDQEIKRGGKDGNMAKIAVNHFRSLLTGVISYVTKDKPAWDTKAVNNDNDALLAADIGNEILDYYMEKGAEECLLQAVEEALIFTAAYVKVDWDEDVEVNPEETRADPATNQIMPDGDLRFQNLNLYDVIYDFSNNDWKRSRWCLTRTQRVAWELIDQYGEEFKDDILNDNREESNAFYYPHVGPQSANQDVVDFWEFYHERTRLCPDGVYFCYVGKKALMEPGPLPKWCAGKPVYRIIPARHLTTSFGYTPAFDLLGVQEAINAEVSTIVTNHANLGPTKLWMKSGDVANLADLEPGWSVVQTDTKPEALNFAGGSSREFIPFKDSLVKDGEYLSGINSAARGQPEASLRSASAIEFVEQKAVQYQAPMIASYYRFLADVGTGAINILQKMAASRRVYAVAGVNNRTLIKAFSKEDIEKIGRVSVIPGNAATQTPIGRATMATELLQAGKIATAEEYFTVRKTGQIRPLTEANDAQANKIRAENELLRQGMKVDANILDNHVFHITKHQSVIDSPEMQLDPFVYPTTLAHILQHLEILSSVPGQMYQIAMGYSVPLPPSSPTLPMGSQGEATQGTQQTQGIPGLGASPQVPGADDMGMEGGQPEMGGNQPGGME